MILFDFSEPAALARWNAIDDRVMGGVSKSEMAGTLQEQQSLATFRGELSLQNNGGFCSVRAALEAPVSADVEHLWIRCANNSQWGSKSYSLNVRTDTDLDGISYRTSFTPGETLTTHEFTAAEFIPVFRGREVLGAEPLYFHDSSQLGLMITDKQVGRFELFVVAIGVS